MDLRGRRALVVGDGELAARKAEALERAGAEVAIRVRFDPADLDGCVLAIGADAPEPELRAVSAESRRRGIPVNVVDRPELCSFITPAVIDRDLVTIAVSSAGVAPVLARMLRARIELAVPPAFAAVARLAQSIAVDVRSRLPDVIVRRRVLERIFSGLAGELALAGDETAAKDAAEAEIAAEVAGGKSATPGVLHFIGVGPGPADLLSLRAHRLLGEADFVLHDATADDAVLDMARRDAQRIDLDLSNAGTDLAALLTGGRRAVWLVGNGPESAAGAAAARTAAESTGIVCFTVPGAAS
jgi:uroporphyrin-III C-methyltransferase/precorrin-2 dehydrogenase/sirohydrochlorin ferrochelatase